MKYVLFLCTGNFYRSRFAEAVFNHAAEAAHIPWRASSRGLATHMAPDAPLSPHTIAALAERGICVHHTAIDKKQATTEDLAAANLIIALRDAEHRPLLQRDFPEFADKVRYWDIADVDELGPERALPATEKLVRALLRELTS